MHRILVLALAVTALAGCSDTTPENPQPSTTLQPTADTGILHGVVVDPAIRPIEGATVRLAMPDGAELSDTTDENGLFGFDKLEPGTYIVRVEKIGYTSAQTSGLVEAAVKAPPSLRVLLEEDAASIPYFTFQKFTGFIECSARAGPDGASLGYGACSGVGYDGQNYGRVGNEETEVTIPYDVPPTFVQAEMTWESTQSTGTGLSLLYGPPRAEGGVFCPDIVYERAAGTSPLMVSGNATDIMGDAANGSNTGACFRVFSDQAPEAGDAAGTSISQEFEIYMTVFYNFEPPEGWMYVNDGEPIVPS